MKKFELPEIEIVSFKVEDIITESGAGENTGWADNGNI